MEIIEIESKPIRKPDLYWITAAFCNFLNNLLSEYISEILKVHLKV